MLTRQNQRLQHENRALNYIAGYWKTTAERAVAQTARTADVLDPKGYCKVFGINPKLLRTLSAATLDKLLISLYRARSLVLHPDVGGDQEDMSALNLAYDFLRDPQKRASYGR